jgi:hypothetical protein
MEQSVMDQVRLSSCSKQFSEFVRQNPGSLKRANYPDLSALHFEPADLQPWPVFINRHTKSTLKEASIGVFELIKRAPRTFFANDVQQLSRYYGIPRHRVSLQLDGFGAKHLESMMARGDFIYSPSGLKCLEYNVSTNVGGWEIAYLEPVYLKTPLIAKFLQESKAKICNQNMVSTILDFFLTFAQKQFPHQAEINMAVAIPGYEESAYRLKEQRYLNRVYKEIRQPECGRAAGQVIFCDYRHLDMVDGHIYYEGSRVHVLIEMYHGQVPAGILKVFKSGSVLLYNGPIAGLLSNKLNLALLSENENSPLFSPAERKIIKKYIPWTRKLAPGHTTYKTGKIRLEHFVDLNRERLVIKPSDQFAGKDVYIGKFTPRSRWQQIVETAMEAKNWLAQEYVESFSYSFQSGENGCAPHLAVWGLFVLGAEYLGAFLRLLPRGCNRGVVSSHQGAEETIVLEVDED